MPASYATSPIDLLAILISIFLRLSLVDLPTLRGRGWRDGYPDGSNPVAEIGTLSLRGYGRAGGTKMEGWRGRRRAAGSGDRLGI